MLLWQDKLLTNLQPKVLDLKRLEAVLYQHHELACFLLEALWEEPLLEALVLHKVTGRSKA